MLRVSIQFSDEFIELIGLYGVGEIHCIDAVAYTGVL